MRYFVNITLLAVGFVLMLTVLSLSNSNGEDSNSPSPLAKADTKDFPVVESLPLEVILPSEVKFWLVLVCFITSTISNLFGWKKKHKPSP